MKFLLLAGGKGTRLNKILINKPKPLASLNGKPFILKILKNIILFKPEVIYITVCHLKEKIIQTLGDNFHGFPIVYIKENNPLGTGGALITGINNINCDGLIVLNADTYTEVNYLELKKEAEKKNKSQIVVMPIREADRFGSIKFDKKNKVYAINEKIDNGPGYINCGCYFFYKNHLNIFENMKNYSLEKQVLPKLINSNNLYAYHYDGKFIDIGIPSDLKRAQTYI